MTRTFSDGHIQSQDERDRDAATVMAIVAQMPAYSEAERTLAHDALVPFTPDDAHAARLDRCDEEAMWAAVIAAGPEVADDEPRQQCPSCAAWSTEDERGAVMGHSHHRCASCGANMQTPLED